MLLVFFSAALSRTLRLADELSILPAVIIVGASVMAIGIAIDATIAFSIAEAVDDIEPASVQTLQALWDNDFIPIAMGVITFLLASGLAIVRTGALPKWLGWVAIVLVVIGFTPAGLRRLPRRRGVDRDRQRHADAAGARGRAPGGGAASGARRLRVGSVDKREAGVGSRA